MKTTLMLSIVLCSSWLFAMDMGSSEDIMMPKETDTMRASTSMGTDEEDMTPKQIQAEEEDMTIPESMVSSQEDLPKVDEDLTPSEVEEQRTEMSESDDMAIQSMPMSSEEEEEEDESESSEKDWNY